MNALTTHLANPADAGTLIGRRALVTGGAGGEIGHAMDLPLQFSSADGRSFCPAVQPTLRALPRLGKCGA